MGPIEPNFMNYEDTKICIECKTVYHKDCESKHAPGIGPCGHKAGIGLDRHIDVMSKQGKEVCCEG